MSKNNKPIVLRPKALGEGAGVVRLTAAAERIVRRLHLRSGLPIRQIVSEIIIQAEGLIGVDHSDFEDI